MEPLQTDVPPGVTVNEPATESGFSDLPSPVKVYSQAPGFVNPGKLYKVEDRLPKKVRHWTDEVNCCIVGICRLPYGRLVIADADNKNLKLLGQRYDVISEYPLPAQPKDVCYVRDFLVAVVVLGFNALYEIHLIDFSTNEGQLHKTLKLDKMADTVVHHKDHFYVGMATCVQVWTTTGEFVKTLYRKEGFCGYRSVAGIEINEAANLMYILDACSNLLLTLDLDGNKVAEIGDEDLRNPCDVCMAGNGSLFVAARDSNTVLQFAGNGQKKLCTVNLEPTLTHLPLSLWFDKHSNELFVGRNNDHILVVKMK